MDGGYEGMVVGFSVNHRLGLQDVNQSGNFGYSLQQQVAEGAT